MTYAEQKKQVIRQFAELAKEQGFKAYLSYNDEYGYFTDAEGKKVISFQLDFGSVVCSANVKNTSGGGTGYRIETGQKPKDFYAQGIPSWYHPYCTPKTRFATQEEYQKDFQKSSKFYEI
jgi:hypothetical protein